MGKYFRYTIGIDEETKKMLDKVVDELRKEHKFLTYISYNTAIKYLIECWRKAREEVV